MMYLLQTGWLELKEEREGKSCRGNYNLCSRLERRAAIFGTQYRLSMCSASKHMVVAELLAVSAAMHIPAKKHRH